MIVKMVFLSLIVTTLCEAQTRPTGTIVKSDESILESTSAATAFMVSHSTLNCGLDPRGAMDIKDVYDILKDAQLGHLVSLVPVDVNALLDECRPAPLQVVNPVVECILRESGDQLYTFTENSNASDFIQKKYKMKKDDADKMIEYLRLMNSSGKERKLKKIDPFALPERDA